MNRAGALKCEGWEEEREQSEVELKHRYGNVVFDLIFPSQ